MWWCHVAQAWEATWHPVISRSGKLKKFWRSMGFSTMTYWLNKGGARQFRGLLYVIFIFCYTGGILTIQIGFLLIFKPVNGDFG
jgi:hypothetical protein